MPALPLSSYVVFDRAEYKTPIRSSARFAARLGGNAARIARQTLVAQFDNPFRLRGTQILGFARGLQRSLLALLQGFLAQFGAMAFEFRLLSAGCHENGSLRYGRSL